MQVNEIVPGGSDFDQKSLSNVYGTRRLLRELLFFRTFVVK